MKLGVMIPHGGLNGDIAVCISHLCNQSVPPSTIYVLVDSNTRSTVPEWLFSLCRCVGIRLLVDYDVKTTSIIDMRLKLLQAMSQLGFKHAVFVDDDMILHHEALFNLQKVALSNAYVPFVEGKRIEVGGRDTKGFDATERKLQSDSALAAGASHAQGYGDTALLWVEVAKFLDFSAEVFTQLRSYYDKRGVGGSDFALTSLVADKFGPGRGCPVAYGWHTASEQRGYWQNYAAADSIFDNVFKPKDAT